MVRYVSEERTYTIFYYEVNALYSSLTNCRSISNEGIHDTNKPSFIL